MTHLTDSFFLSLFSKQKDRIFSLRFKKTEFDDVENDEYVVVNFMVKALAYIGDYPALQEKLNMKQTTGGLRLCRRCLVPNDKLFETAIKKFRKRDLKKESEMRLQYNEHKCRGGNVQQRKEASEYLHSHRLYPAFGGLHSWFDFDCSDNTRGFRLSPEEDCPFETMHLLEHGVFKQICLLLNKIFTNTNGAFNDI